MRLHRCGNRARFGPCWRVQKALDDAGVPYDVVKGPLLSGKRDRLQQLTGQRKYPAIEFEDGSAYREQSKDMAATIAAGALDSKRPGLTR
jgi:glutathione S-transferase